MVSDDRPSAGEIGYSRTIHGLRGFLALGVFAHHAIVWHRFLIDGVWHWQDTRLVAHLGTASVSLFFMVTGYLFWSKVLHARELSGNIDWRQLLIGRVFRLVPLYLVTVILVLVVVAWRTGWTACVPTWTLVRQSASWLLFTAPGAPAINGFNEMWLLFGVAWTLVYEWFFYLALPLLSVLVFRRVTMTWLFMGAGAVGLFVFNHLTMVLLLAFAGGMCSAHFSRREHYQPWAKGLPATALALACLALAVTLWPTAYHTGSLLLLTGFFAIVACGNSLGAVLTHPVAQFGGSISYGIYLLHMPLLFVSFTLFLGRDHASTLGLLPYTGVILVIGGLLVGLTWLTNLWVEAPAIAAFRRMRSDRSTLLRRDDGAVGQA